MKVLTIFGLGLATSLVALASTARADIKQPNAHDKYSVELEPHLAMVLFHPGWGAGRGYRGSYRSFGTPEFGGGFRASIPIVDPGFIPKLNNTVALTFGLDFTNCRYCRKDFSVFLPEAGIQWNFFFSDKFSAFADLGFQLRNVGFYNDVTPDFFAMIGGRFHINRTVALTARIGYPFFTFGASFFL
jgi:hypothetical protein